MDVGAGTGTLAIAIAARRPDAQVIAVDGDPEGYGSRGTSRAPSG
jgi:precorrin-6B methylase 2